MSSISGEWLRRRGSVPIRCGGGIGRLSRVSASDWTSGAGVVICAVRGRRLVVFRAYIIESALRTITMPGTLDKTSCYR
ncbi:hypothetical protein [Lentzea albidocapillata]|uniref:Uncharacterized protein n=1 Tax=Lentzea albidocapillata TaxID=40571 RepID=A0A1W1ZIL6_9PSEU|nr:hypothetical protein [Lentzea albidocapillata]SMC48217.1 hypothetical protein SAMN05660733_00003 [Lentzea albidocapillata]